MRNWHNAPLQQIHLGIGSHAFESVGDYKSDAKVYAQEQEAYETNLIRRCPAPAWPKDSYKLACFRPILVSNQHKQQLAELHGALAAAITDIVHRWWTDQDARFPERMPLQKKEEDLLQESTFTIARRPILLCSCKVNTHGAH
jgi:hypothetical protein